MGKKNKTPKIIQSPETIKKPKYLKNPEGYENKLIAWHFHRMDKEGVWACNYEIIKNISNRLHEYEIKKWNEITDERSNHPMPTNKIEKSAQKRLTELGIDDTETLYQIDIKGIRKKNSRLWGIRQENIFQVLWWDLNHTVYIPNKYKK